MLSITTTFEHIGHWIKMRQSLARFSGPESSPQIRSLADFIATTSGFSFSVHTGRKPPPGDIRQFLTTMDPDVIRAIKQAALDVDRTASDVMEEAAKQWLER